MRVFRVSYCTAKNQRVQDLAREGEQMNQPDTMRLHGDTLHWLPRIVAMLQQHDCASIHQIQGEQPQESRLLARAPLHCVCRSFEFPDVEQRPCSEDLILHLLLVPAILGVIKAQRVLRAASWHAICHTGAREGDQLLGCPEMGIRRNVTRITRVNNQRYSDSYEVVGTKRWKL